MKILMDEILQDVVERTCEGRRLGRNGTSANRERVFAKVLAELESVGDAMRYQTRKGRIGWKATPQLRDYIMDLQLDAESDFEQEDV